MTSREYHRKYREENRDKVKASQERHNRKKKQPCRWCGGKMPYPMPGGRYCSDRCRDAVKKELRIKRREAGKLELDAFKIKRGCTRCGYQKCAAALDFHHIDKGTKTKRIKAENMSEAAWQEIAKCILLCANCHREEHHA